MPRFLIVLDTPGIKQFVFGTDTLSEIRGASAILDRLNRRETEERLAARLPGGVQRVFAGGGAAQFVVHAPTRKEVVAAVNELMRAYRRATGDEVRIVAGVVEWPGTEDTGYQNAIREALREIGSQRRSAFGHPTVPTFPLVLECQSTSHLPATEAFATADGQLLLSVASRLKRIEARESRSGMLWHGWLESVGGLSEIANQLRPEDALKIGERSGRRGYVGLIYADGNAMGRLFSQIKTREVYAALSELVDKSVREACYAALTEACAPELRAAEASFAQGETPSPLPADILLLGGDDLVILLPADRALRFALRVSEDFERLTREKRTSMSHSVQQFFSECKLGECGLTISCGVAIGPANYPFYLLCGLAEELLKSAKRGGSVDRDRPEDWPPSYIDFHVLAGSASQELSAAREDDYRQDDCKTEGDYSRTLRPYSRHGLQQLRGAVARLRQGNLPASKRQDLFDAALDVRRLRAELRAQELFGRLREDRTHHERSALWQALEQVSRIGTFPWTTTHRGRHATALADLIEAYDLFPDEEQR